MASVIITVKVDEEHTSDVVNTVCVEEDNSDPESPVCNTDSTKSGKMVDWELEKSHIVPEADQSAVAGETVRYQLKVHNNGPSASAGPITITDILPAAFTYVPATSSQGEPTITTNDDGSQVLVWTVDGPFRTGKNLVTIEFEAAIADDAAEATYVNKARVDGVTCQEGDEDCIPEPGDDPTNNDDEDEIPVVRSADMHIVKQVQDAAGEWVESTLTAAGTQVAWRVTITNDGPSAVPVTFTDALPAGLTLLSLEGDDWDCSVAEATCQYTGNGGLHPVGADNASTIEFTSLVASNVPPTGNDALVNWGAIRWVDSTTEDPTDKDDASVTVTRVADLGLVKTALDAEGNETETVVAGESLWYNLVVTNHGPSDVIAPIVVNDTLPAGISFVGLSAESAAAWTAEVDAADPQNVTFTRQAGLVAEGSAPQIVFEAKAAASLPTGESLLNVAEIDQELTLDPNGDPTQGEEWPDSDLAQVTAERVVDLGVVKTHDADKVRIGDQLPFDIKVTNFGPSQATGITVTDTVPAGLEVVSAPGDGVGIGWTLDSVTANENGTTTVVATYADALEPRTEAELLTLITLVKPAAYESVTNLVVVVGNEPEPKPDPNPNKDEDPVQVPPMVTLIVEKTGVGDFAVNQTGEFRITVTNMGPTPDPGPITVTDPLPKGMTFVSSPDKNVSVKNNVVTWTLNDGLGVGESATLTLFVNLEREASSLTNVAYADTPSETTPDSKITDDDTVTVTKDTDQIAKTGAAVVGALLVAAALLLVGAGGVVFARRRS